MTYENDRLAKLVEYFVKAGSRGVENLLEAIQFLEDNEWSVNDSVLQIAEDLPEGSVAKLLENTDFHSAFNKSSFVGLLCQKLNYSKEQLEEVFEIVFENNPLPPDLNSLSSDLILPEYI